MKIRNVKINATIKGVDSKYKPLFEKSLERMKIVYESQEFLDAMKAVIKSSNNLEGELSKWKNKSAVEIYEQFFNRYDKESDTYHLDLEIETYYTSKRVIGYGVVGDDIIRVNTKYLSSYTLTDEYDLRAVGSNLTHEEYHNKGMSHDSNATARRKHSVCYLSNDAYEIAYSKLFIEKIKTPQPAPAIEIPSPTPPVLTKPPVITEPPVEVPKEDYVTWYNKFFGFFKKFF